MLFIYGPFMPIRLLEQIYFWKMQEKEHVAVIQAAVPSLEPDYKKLLTEWKTVFSITEHRAQQWINALVRSLAENKPSLLSEVNLLIPTATLQSQQYIRHLFLIMDKSAELKKVPTAKVLIQHSVRESNYFLGVLQAIAATNMEKLQNNNNDANTKLKPNASFSSEKNDPLHQTHKSSRSDKTHKVDLTELTVTSEGTWTSLLPSPNPDTVPVSFGGHVLPPLPYAYHALEPHLDEQTMRLHHQHHLEYVNRLNEAEKLLAQARLSNDFSMIKHFEREAAFHGAGHYLHSMFWNMMSPNGGGVPKGILAKQIGIDFGSFESFKAHFSAAAEKVEGSGWMIVVWSPRIQRLEIVQAEKHQNQSQWESLPLLVLDLWEHAYYLKYPNHRAEYVDAWWNVVNWSYVSARFVRARMLKLDVAWKT